MVYRLRRTGRFRRKARRLFRRKLGRKRLTRSRTRSRVAGASTRQTYRVTSRSSMNPQIKVKGYIRKIRRGKELNFTNSAQVAISTVIPNTLPLLIWDPNTTYPGGGSVRCINPPATQSAAVTGFTGLQYNSWYAVVNMMFDSVDNIEGWDFLRLMVLKQRVTQSQANNLAPNLIFPTSVMHPINHKDWEIFYDKTFRYVDEQQTNLSPGARIFSFKIPLRGTMQVDPASSNPYFAFPPVIYALSYHGNMIRIKEIYTRYYYSEY